MTKKQLGDYYSLFLSAALTLPFGFLFGIIVTDWSKLSDKFLEVSLIQLIQTFLPILVAFFVVQYVSNRVNNNKQRKDVYLELINEFRSTIKKDFDLVSEFIERPTQESQRQILRCFSEANSELKDIQDLGRVQSLISESVERSLEKDLINFKNKSTEPFGNKTPKYTDLGKKAVYDSYHTLLKNINLTRCRLFE